MNAVKAQQPKKKTKKNPDILFFELPACACQRCAAGKHGNMWVFVFAMAFICHFLNNYSNLEVQMVSLIWCLYILLRRHIPRCIAKTFGDKMGNYGHFGLILMDGLHNGHDGTEASTLTRQLH